MQGFEFRDFSSGLFRIRVQEFELGGLSLGLYLELGSRAMRLKFRV